MVLYIPTHSHFNPPHVSPSILHSFHTSTSSSCCEEHLSLHPPSTSIWTFIPPSALLLLPGEAITHALHVFVLQICLACWSPGSPCLSFSELAKPPEKSWNVSLWSPPCSGHVLFSVMGEKNFPSLVPAVVFSSLSGFSASRLVGN